EPAGIAMGENVDGALPVNIPGSQQQARGMPPDLAVACDILVADRGAFGPCRRRALRRRQAGDTRANPLEGPAQVDRGRPSCEQFGEGRLESLIAGIEAQGERKPVGADRTDQRSTADLHRADGFGTGLRRGEGDLARLERQERLVDRARQARRVDPETACHCPPPRSVPTRLRSASKSTMRMFLLETSSTPSSWKRENARETVSSFRPRKLPISSRVMRRMNSLGE